MMKKRLLQLLLFLVLVGVFSVTISLKDFFFTTKFYQEPLSAYNADAVYDPIYGDTTVNRTIGLFKIEKEKALFIGELSKDKFIVAEMKVKDKGYAYEGTVFFYSTSDLFNENNYNQTETKTGNVKWDVINNKQGVEKLQNIKLVNEYSMSDGSPLFLVIFE